ncbi:MAG TPA: hypothetical protein VMZ03_05245, partial [Chitinophagaceae bacterium]|nr:hypothetical protein [Chitinophagaceae bacterium]
MKNTLIALVALLSSSIVFSQDITGLWTGTIKNDAEAQSMPYEVFISKDKGKAKFSGYSKTMYLDEGKECYSIKKLKVSVARDGKIVLLDATVMENDYPFVDKYGKQVNVLDLFSNDTGTSLDGIFVNNPKFSNTTGRISLKRVTTVTESSL